MKLTSLLFTMLFTCGYLQQAAAQEVLIGGHAGERLLVWKDFQGNPDKKSTFFAETFWNLNFKTSGIQAGSGELSSKNVALTLGFNSKKSWLRKGKGTTELLKHEQGHFDIGRLCQLEMLSILKNTELSKANFGTKMQAVFEAAMNKYTVMGEQYDAETNHSIDQKKQEEWNNFLLVEKERLLKLNQ